MSIGWPFSHMLKISNNILKHMLKILLTNPNKHACAKFTRVSSPKEVVVQF